MRLGDYYSYHMIEMIRSEQFDKWVSGLRDLRAIARIAARLERLAMGHEGDAKPVGGGVSEMRIDYGPGYRIYYMRRGQIVVILLLGGDKSTQSKDISLDKAMAEDWKR